MGSLSYKIYLKDERKVVVLLKNIFEKNGGSKIMSKHVSIIKCRIERTLWKT